VLRTAPDQKTAFSQLLPTSSNTDSAARNRAEGHTHPGDELCYGGMRNRISSNGDFATSRGRALQDQWPWNEDRSQANTECMTVDLRSTIKELDEHDCWDLLQRQEVGRLAVDVANHPDIFPVNYVVDHHTVVFRTAEGTKLVAAVLGAPVAFEVDGELAGEAWSVVLKGHAFAIENMYEMFDALDLPLYPWNRVSKRQFVRIIPDEVTGRHFLIADRATNHAGDLLGASG
jgi:hypothetical protein